MKVTHCIETFPAGPEALPSLREFGDAELLDAWTRDRLSEAFAVLVQRHSQMVLTVCRRKCRSAADADDAFQTTFLLLAKNSAKISRPECLAGWLHRVAQRASIATLSRKKRTPEPKFEQVMIDDPLDKITQQHDAIVLDEELADLPEHYRAVLVMHVYEDCPLERMAEHFQTTLGSIRGRLQRGKKLLASRLRRRGIVPLLAVAAAGSVTVSAGDVSAASTALLASLESGTVPAPPIPEHLLHPLVSSGKRIMTPWNAAGSIAAVGTIAAMLIAPGFGSDDGGQASKQPPASISIHAPTQPIAAQFSAPVGGGTQDQNVPSPAATPAGTITAPSSGPFSSVTPGAGRTVIQRQYRSASADSPLAQSLFQKMDEPMDLHVQGNVDAMVRQLEDQLGQPVILDQRAVKYAELEPSASWSFDGRSEPLRSGLRKLLQPLGLKATIQNEALVITADHSELVHRGIGTDQWLSVNDDMMREAEKKLTMPISETFIDTPLDQAVSMLSEQIDLAIKIDARSLEEIGLTSDSPVNLEVKNIAAYDLISAMLSDLDLTLSVKDNMHRVVSSETAETDLLGRVYWLEGVGMGGDFDSLISLIETTIQSDTWEALGGASTMSPAPGSRPGLVVSTTLGVHRRIEKLLAALRENSFGLDAVAEDVQVTLPNLPAGTIGGFGGGGGGFGGGQIGGGFM